MLSAAAVATVAPAPALAAVASGRSGLRISVPPLPQSPTAAESAAEEENNAAAKKAPRLFSVPAGERYAVELPVKFVVYFLVGFNSQFAAKLLFQHLGPLGKDFGIRLL